MTFFVAFQIRAGRPFLDFLPFPRAKSPPKGLMGVALEIFVPLGPNTSTSKEGWGENKDSERVWSLDREKHHEGEIGDAEHR